MPRSSRIIAPNYPHHVVQRGNNKQLIFYNDKDRCQYLTLLKKYSNECDCAIHAYCLMSNHVHMLIVPKYETSLSKTMQKISLVFTQYLNRVYKRTGRLWECRFYSSIIDNNDYLFTACRYIERNPVRANIVKSPLAYKWSSAKVNVLDDRDDIITPAFHDYDKKIYADYLSNDENKDETELIRRCTLSGKPMGSSNFIKDISIKTGISIGNLSLKPEGRPCKNRDTSRFS